MPVHARTVLAGFGFALPLAFALFVHADSQAPELSRSSWGCLAYGAVLSLPFLALLSLFVAFSLVRWFRGVTRTTAAAPAKN